MSGIKDKLSSAKKNPQLLKNIKLLWSASTRDPLFKKYLMGNYFENLKLLKKVSKAIVSAGFPRQMVSSLTGYYVDDPPSVDRYLNNTLSYMDATTERFLSGDIADALSNLSATLQELDEEETEAIESAAEAPPRAPLGRIAFSPFRVEKSIPKNEINTEREAQLYDALEAHVDRNIKLPKEETDFIKSMMKQGRYENMFKEPEHELLYRGMNIPGHWLKKILGLRPGAPLKEKGSAKVNFLYRPKQGNATSWSTKKTVAKTFGGPGMYEIIFTASVADNPNAFLDLDGIYKVYPMNYFKREKEVIGMGKIRVTKIEWKQINLDED